MSFEHPTPAGDEREQPLPFVSPTEGELPSLIPPPPPQRIPYKPRGFRDIYEEAKWLRKLSGNTAIAFVLIFVALLAAGSYADAVELRRLNPELFAAQYEAMAEREYESLEEQDSTLRAIALAAAEDTRNMDDIGFLERFGLKLLSAIGTIGFFVFCSAAVSEISFRAYENREMEPYEVLDTLTKTHGMKLLQLGGIFLLPLLVMGLISITAVRENSTSGMLFTFLLSIVMYCVALRYSFSVQALIGEELTPMQAIRRSWRLTQSNFWRLVGWWIAFTFFFWLVAVFFYLLPMMIVGILAMLIFSWAGPVVSLILLIIAAALMVKHYSLIFFFQMALYRELRLRLDGEDPLPVQPAVQPVSA